METTGVIIVISFGTLLFLLLLLLVVCRSCKTETQKLASRMSARCQGASRPDIFARGGQRPKTLQRHTHTRTVRIAILAILAQRFNAAVSLVQVDYCQQRERTIQRKLFYKIILRLNRANVTWRGWHGGGGVARGG